MSVIRCGNDDTFAVGFIEIVPGVLSPGKLTVEGDPRLSLTVHYIYITIFIGEQYIVFSIGYKIDLALVGELPARDVVVVSSF